MGPGPLRCQQLAALGTRPGPAARAFGLAPPVAPGAGHQAACPHDQRGDFLGCGVRYLRQYRGVGVGGQHDARMAKHLLHDPQVHPGSQGQRRSTVTQVMKPNRRQARHAGELAEGTGEPVGGHRVPIEIGEHEPAGPVPGAACGGFGALAVPVRGTAATVVRSRAITRALRAVFGGQITSRPSCCCSRWVITAVLASRSISHQRSPAASPRRSPRSAIR